VAETVLVEKNSQAVESGAKGSTEEACFPSRYLCFGPFCLDISNEQLYRNNSRIKLFGKPVKLLGKLLEKPGEIVSRDRLSRCLWKGEPDEGIYANLTTTLNKLRRALGDSSLGATYIETVRGAGYRFMVPVEYVESPPSTSNGSALSTTLREPRNVSRWQRLVSSVARCRFPVSSAVMVLTAAVLVGLGSSFVWVAGVRPRSAVGVVVVGIVAVATAAMVFACADLIVRSRKMSEKRVSDEFPQK
jgi:DNA-binding winged helix-turn-helix (wHTH) protein